jgi:hypothetical protein
MALVERLCSCRRLGVTFFCFRQGSSRRAGLDIRVTPSIA